MNNSFSFTDLLSIFNNVDQLFITSFEVEFIFANIPLQETIELCISEMFNSINTVS